MRIEQLEPQPIGCCDNCGDQVTEQQVAIDNGDTIYCAKCAPFID